MGNSSSSPQAVPVTSERLKYDGAFGSKPRPLKADGTPVGPCCVCKETKLERDECVVSKGEEHCGDLIERHKACMREYGFNV